MRFAVLIPNPDPQGHITVPMMNARELEQRGKKKKEKNGC